MVLIIFNCNMFLLYNIYLSSVLTQHVHAHTRTHTHLHALLYNIVDRYITERTLTTVK